MSERLTRRAAKALVVAYRDGHVTLREAMRAVEVRRACRGHATREGALDEALYELFVARRGLPPDPAIVDLVVAALDAGTPCDVRDAMLALALRRPVLAAVAPRAAAGDVPSVILRPGCRVLLGTERGRAALDAMLAGDVKPLRDWLERTVIGRDAFAATTLDVPLGNIAGLARLVDRLVLETERLPPGRARARVADEWISEVLVDCLDDEAPPYTELVRIVGERLLESDSPALLWHAAKQLSLVAPGDPALAERVLGRCLPLARLEDGRSPAGAAAPFLQVLAPSRAAALLEELAPRLDRDGFDAVAAGFLAPALRRAYGDWRDPLARFASGASPGLARAALKALLDADVSDATVVDWFRNAPSPGVRSACRALIARHAA
jgi:hypothetical protein